jgi:hypothetical protein
VTAVEVDISQTVHVVSIEEVTMSEGLITFHEKLVRGALVGLGFLDYEARIFNNAAILDVLTTTYT